MAADREFKARSIAKAVKIAAKELGQDADDLQYDIISHGASGIFGLTGVKKAIIRVHLPEALETNPIGMDEDRPYFTSEGEALNSTVANGGDSPGDEDNLEKVFETGEAMLRRIVEAISPEAAIQVQRESNKIRFNIRSIYPHRNNLLALIYHSFVQVSIWVPCIKVCMKNIPVTRHPGI